MRKETRRILLGGAAVAVLAVGVWWVARPAAVAIELAIATQGPLRVTLDDDGETRVRNHVTLSAPVSGRLLATRLEAGDSVAPGDTVLVMVAAPLDPRAREQAEAARRAAQAVVSQARSRVEVARIDLADAERSLTRARRLHATGALSDRDFEAAERLRDVRVRELSMAVEQLGANQAELSSVRAALEDANAALAPTGSRIVIRAPGAGRILRLHEAHERLVAAGTPLADLGNPENLEVVVAVLSSDAGLVRVGAPMLVNAREDTTAIAALVTRVEPAAFTKLSPLGVQEQRVNVHGVFTGRPPPLGDAFQVGVAIVLWERPDALRIPGSALVAADTGLGWAVFRVRGGRAHLETVRIGHRGANQVEVLSGLAAGDTVVERPNDKIRNGIRVEAPAPGRRGVR